MATETIPVIDLGPFLAGEPGALDRTAKELRFALTEIGFYFIVNHGVPREKIRGVVRAGEALPRPAGREEAGAQDRHQQHRLPADARQHAAHLDDPGRHQAQPERGLLRQARAAGRSSRRARRPPLPRRQSLARAACRASARPSSTIARRWSGWCRRWCGSMPAPSTCRPTISTRPSRTASTRCA